MNLKFFPLNVITALDLGILTASENSAKTIGNTGFVSVSQGILS